MSFPRKILEEALSKMKKKKKEKRKTQIQGTENSTQESKKTK